MKIVKKILFICMILIIAILSFTPWLIILKQQAASVSSSYWIAPITLNRILGYFWFVLSPDNQVINANQIAAFSVLGLLLLIGVIVLLIKSDKKDTYGILIAVCVPGNQVLPFGDLATIGFFVAMAVAVHRGNLFRTLISGVIIMSITLWIATQTIGLHTQLAANAGALKAGGMVASMDQGGSPITWLLIQVFSPQNIPGFIVIGAIYLTGIFMTWRRARGFIKQEKAVLAE